MIRRIGLRVLVCLFFLLAAAPARAGDVAGGADDLRGCQGRDRTKEFHQRRLRSGRHSRRQQSLRTGGSCCARAKRFSTFPTPTTIACWDSRKFPKRMAHPPSSCSARLISRIRAVGPAATSFEFPSAVATAGNQLFVTEFDNNRVLIWNKLPTKTDTPANVVVGQPDFTSNTPATTQSGLNLPESGLFVAGGKLLVSDRNNNRIMIWNSIPTTNGANADVVVGQPDFTSNGTGVSQTGLDEPEGLWSDGTRLVVADFINNRVLIWNTIPTTNGAPADVVVGQPDFTSIDNPAADRAESQLNRGPSLRTALVCLWRIPEITASSCSAPFPTSNNPTASIVLGQADFTHSDGNAGNATPTAQTSQLSVRIISCRETVDRRRQWQQPLPDL